MTSAKAERRGRGRPEIRKAGSDIKAGATQAGDQIKTSADKAKQDIKPADDKS